MIADPKRVMLLGDVHGSHNWTRHAIEHAASNGADVIVSAGDFGHWSPGHSTYMFYRDVHAKLEEHDIILYWVDGNHEDHADIAQRRQGSREPMALNEDFPRIIHLPRGFRWEWWGKTWMALGGAVSVDKFNRTEGRSWWPGETLTDEDVEFASRPGKVDVLIAHDAPYGMHIPGIKPMGQSEWPDWVLYEAYDHQRKISAVMGATRPALVTHGHMHVRYQGFHQYGDGSKCLVQGLDCDGTTLDRNTLFLDRS